MTRKRAVAAAVGVTAVAAVVFHAPLLTGYAHLFRVDDATPGADLILILSGHPETRGPKAIDLYRQGYAPQVMVTNALPTSADGEASHPHQYDVLNGMAARERLAIPMISPGPRWACSTYDEAHQAARYAKTHAIKRLIVVTDAYHTARARYTFDRIFREQQVDARVELAAAEDEFNETNWWSSLNGIRNYLIEPVKMVYYVVR